jgi:hypothetical protein
MDQGNWRLVTDCAMRSHFIVLSTPLFRLGAGVVQIQEPMPAKTLEPDAGVEVLDVGVVGSTKYQLSNNPGYIVAATERK